MAERYTRCRFYPHCQIHLGEPAPRWFSNRNHSEMREMYLIDKLPIAEIARRFSANRGSVADIVNPPRKDSP